ncbi:MAG TPA: hypothetical protein VIA07_10510 [Desulfuromonadales bacterium]|jgi:hypothetical protein
MSNTDFAHRLNALEPPLPFLHSLSSETPPASLSALGLSLAANKGDFLQGIALCKEAIRLAPENPVHYFHLGKVYLAGGKKHLALHAFRRGLKFGYHRGLVREIERLGFRRPPIFPFLGRKHPLNRFAGILFTRLGLQ